MKPGDQISYFFGNHLLGFWKMAADGRVTWWSRKHCKFDGMTYEERFGKS